MKKTIITLLASIGAFLGFATYSMEQNQSIERPYFHPKSVDHEADKNKVFIIGELISKNKQTPMVVEFQMAVGVDGRPMIRRINSYEGSAAKKQGDEQ